VPLKSIVLVLVILYQQVPLTLTFVFTANTNSFTANTTSFKYEVYKFDSNLTAFTTIPVYKSNLLEYSGFSGTNSTYQTIPVNQLLLDGEYLMVIMNIQILLNT
jgi:hypothetical protein